MPFRTDKIFYKALFFVLKAIFCKFVLKIRRKNKRKFQSNASIIWINLQYIYKYRYGLLQ